MTLFLFYLRYMCFFASAVVISIHRPGSGPLYIQGGVNNYRMAAVFITQG
jgi:hypothetical protein